MTPKEKLDRQSECISVARTVPRAFQQVTHRPGVQPLSPTDLTAYTLFYDPRSGLACFDLNWDQGDAFSTAEQQYCQRTGR